MHDSFGIHSFHTLPLQLLPRRLPRIRRVLLLLLPPPRAFHEQERSGKDHFARRRLDERRISVLVNRELLPPIDPHLRFCGRPRLWVNVDADLLRRLRQLQQSEREEGYRVCQRRNSDWSPILHTPRKLPDHGVEYPERIPHRRTDRLCLHYPRLPNF